MNIILEEFKIKYAFSSPEDYPQMMAELEMLFGKEAQNDPEANELYQRLSKCSFKISRTDLNAYIYDWEHIKNVRKDQNLTQADCAKKAGMSVRQWQQYENNEKEPGVRTFCRIAFALEEDTSNFFNIGDCE